MNIVDKPFSNDGEYQGFDWEEFGLKVLKQADAGQVKSYLMKQDINIM